MIEGLKVRIPSEELSSLMAARADHHEHWSVIYQKELLRPEAERGDRDVPDHMLAHDRDAHRERAAVLRFIRDRLIPGETYILAEYDLRLADLLGDDDYDLYPPRKHGGEPLQMETTAFGVTV